MKGREKGFASGVFLLTLSAICAKLCGPLFKIPLVSIIGDGGMGYFNSAYVIYTFFYVLSTSGLPVGLSILVSKCVTEKEKMAYLKSAFAVFGGIGLLFYLLMLFFSDALAMAIGNPQAAFSIRVMGPGLLAVCLCGCIRGYFQGQKDMMPTALSQVIESVLKTALGLLLAKVAMDKGATPAVTAAAALIGVSVGSVCALFYLALLFFIKQKGRADSFSQKDQKRSGYTKRLLLVVLPVSAASIVISISSVIDLSVIMGRLQDMGYSAEAANELYGNYSGTAVPLFNLPAVLVSPIASSVIPYLAASGKEERSPAVLSGMALRLCSLVASPCLFGLAFLARPILTLLFNERSAYMAAPLLTLLAPSVYFVALQTVSGAVLQGRGHRRLPVAALLVGAVVKIVSCYLLIPQMGMAGAPVGTMLCYLAACGINLLFCVKKQLLELRPLKTFVLPCFCGAACAFAARMLYRLFGADSCALLLAIGLSVPIYLSLLLLTGVLDGELTALLPFLSRFEGKGRRVKRNIKENHGL